MITSSTPTSSFAIFVCSLKEDVMGDKVRVGISIGDINGIGPEVIIKTLNNAKILDMCIPVIYGSAKVVAYHKNVVKANDFSFHSLQDAHRLNYKKVNVLNCWEDTVNINLGTATEDGGKCAHIALDRATRDLDDGLIDVLVTAPINKQAMHLAQFNAPGHTEYLQDRFGGEALMIMVSDAMRIALVTGHMALGDVSMHITKEHVNRALAAFLKTLHQDFGLDKPQIAVLGLNPHASDNGLFGHEEEEVIRPVIIESKKAGNLVMGPYSADGFFGSGLYKKFDGILAMYHDQALIPFKSLSFGDGVNYTAGLPYIRTSPDHGTGYDLVGNGEANEQSFRRALYLSIDLFRERKEFVRSHANSLNNKDKNETAKSTEQRKDELPAAD